MIWKKNKYCTGQGDKDIVLNKKNDLTLDIKMPDYKDIEQDDLTPISMET